MAADTLTIPERLDWLLRRRNMSTDTLALQAKMSPQTIVHMREGRVPKANLTKRISHALGVPNSFFASRPMTEDQLLAIVDRHDSKGIRTTTTRKATTVSKTTGAAKKKPSTTRKATAKKPAAKKPVARKSVAKKTAAKKAVAKKPTVKKAVAKKTAAKPAARKAVKKTVAKKPVAKKAVAKKPVAKKAVAKKVVAKKAVAKKPVTRKTTSKKTVAKRPAAKVVRHGTVKRSSTAARNGNGAGIGVDRQTLVKTLVKLSRSKQDAVALEATKALLTLVK